MDLSFYRDKTVLITGHTGFKGTWLSRILIEAGAKVIGYALQDNSEPSLFYLSKNAEQMISIFGDVRDFDKLHDCFLRYEPEIVFHLAAQPLVRLSYEMPVETFSTNVMGTVHVLECVRKCSSVKSFLNVTTDKVYLNLEKEYAYKEEDRLDGYDPYSNSKSCSELVTGSYKNSFFNTLSVATSTARSGNVIGGGDFSKDRIIPDCYRAALSHQDIVVRNPDSTRPYQHVLDTLHAYLLIAQRQYEQPDLASSYNIGPDNSDNLKTQNLVELFCNFWGDELHWVHQPQDSVHEANLLQLDHSKIQKALGWKPYWNSETAVLKSVEWYKALSNGLDMKTYTIKQIQEFLENVKKSNNNRW